jgi:hypothetical protein
MIWIEPSDYRLAAHIMGAQRCGLKHETEWREGRHAAVYTFHNGKAIEMRIFDDQREAFEWAGVAP